MSKMEYDEKTSEMKFSDGQYESHEHKPLTFWEFFWNPKTGEFLGRTAMSWLKITIFYIIYYICLAAFFLVCYKIFAAASLSPYDKPRWTQDDGLIGSNPGVGFRPMPDQEKVESTLIWTNRKTELEESPWAELLFNFTQEYRVNMTEHSQECDFNSTAHANKDKFCIVKVDSMAGCVAGPTNKSGFGYTHDAGTPCVLIKLNKIYGWTPEPYKTAADLETAAKRGMPQTLLDTIGNLTKDASINPFKAHQLDTVWVSCAGENPGDKESIGPISFFAPGFGNENFPGIPAYFYPYMNQPGYQAPFVFVRFDKPRPNTLIQVECKAWALNIIADRYTKQGLVHFEIMMDE